MQEFLNKLYSYEYFGTYLMISIIVLLLLFIIILFFGKKDQKNREIEATKKLQQINSEDAFKDESAIQSLEANGDAQKLENDTIVVPTIEDVPTIDNNIADEEIPEPVLPIENDTINSEPVISNINDQESMPVEPQIQSIDQVSNSEISIDSTNDSDSRIDESEPILNKVEEKPLVFNNSSELFSDEPVNDDNEIEQDESVIPEVDIPIFNFDEIVQDVEEDKNESIYNKGSEIFSSVYAPKKEESNLEDVDFSKIDIPEKRDEVKVPTMEELEIELPSLKKDFQDEEKNEQIDMPVLNDYNLDDLSGETYIIDK